MSPSRLLAMGIFFEGLFVVLALGIAWLFDFYDVTIPFLTFFAGDPVREIVIGSLLAVPLLLGVKSLEKVRFEPIAKFFDYVYRNLTPLFAPLKWWQAALLSIAAGVGEEILFRWCIQGGLTRFMHPALAVSIAAIIFGLMHCLSLIYVLLTTAVGVLLGIIYIYFGPLAAIACHAMYDFLAIVIFFSGANELEQANMEPPQ